MPRLIIANIDYLVTVDPSRQIIRDGAIVIQDGRIAGVGKTAEFPSNPGDNVIDGRGKPHCPGCSIPTFTTPSSSGAAAGMKPIRGRSGCSAGCGRSRRTWKKGMRCARRGLPSSR